MEREQWIYWKVLNCCGGGGLGRLFNPGSRIKLAITSSSPLPFPLTPTAPQSVSVYITLPASACAPLQETWKRKSGKLNLQPITSPIAQYTCLLFFQSGGALIFYNGSLCSQCHVTTSSITSGSDQKSITCLWRGSGRRCWLRWKVRKDQGGGRGTSSASALLDFEVQM